MQMLQTQHSTVPRSYGTRMPVLSTHVTLKRHFFLYLALKSTQQSSDTYVHDTSVTSPVVLQAGMFSPLPQTSPIYSSMLSLKTAQGIRLICIYQISTKHKAT